jgi:hypothetical protein
MPGEAPGRVANLSAVPPNFSDYEGPKRREGGLSAEVGLLGLG